MPLCDMEHDRSCLEQAKASFFIRGNLTERMPRQMLGALHPGMGHKANVIRLSRFFERPTNTRVPGQSLATIGRIFKGGNRDRHRRTPVVSCGSRPVWAFILTSNEPIENRRGLQILSPPGYLVAGAPAPAACSAAIARAWRI